MYRVILQLPNGTRPPTARLRCARGGGYHSVLICHARGGVGCSCTTLRGNVERYSIGIENAQPESHRSTTVPRGRNIPERGVSFTFLERDSIESITFGRVLDMRGVGGTEPRETTQRATGTRDGGRPCAWGRWVRSGITQDKTRVMGAAPASLPSPTPRPRHRQGSKWGRSRQLHSSNISMTRGAL